MKHEKFFISVKGRKGEHQHPGIIARSERWKEWKWRVWKRLVPLWQRDPT